MNIFDQDLLFCDLETTGGNSRIDRIIEIGLVHVRGGQIIETYQQLVNPGRPIVPFITQITGIDNSMVQGQPTFDEIAAEIFDRLDGKVFIAHSAQFDYRFLQRELALAGYDFKTKPICTVKLSRTLYPEFKKHNLDSLLERFDLTCSDRHRALDDAAVLWDLWQIFQAEHGDAFELAIEKQIQKPKIELKICASVFDTLPQTPGVYIFSDDERPLFIGSASNIAAQVKKHFTAEDPKKCDRKLAREMTKIETLDSVGPIQARLQMIEQKKQLRPRYNRRLNQFVEHWGFRLVRDQVGVLQPDFFSFIAEEEGIEIGCFGLFIHRKQAEKTFRELVLGAGLSTEKNAPNPLLYNVRLELALSTLKHQAWPHEGIFLVKETCPHRQQSVVHGFDNWCYVGSATTDEEVLSLSEVSDQKFCPYLYPVVKSVVGR